MVAPSENDIQNYFRTFPFFLLFSANSKFFFSYLQEQCFTIHNVWTGSRSASVFLIQQYSFHTKLPLRESSPGEKLAQSYIRNALHSPTIVSTDKMTLAEYFQNTYLQPLLSKLSFHMLTLISGCNTRISGIQ